MDLRDRRLFAHSCRCSPPCGGAQIIYSAAGGRRSVPHAGAVCPRYVLPLGYEYYDARVRCLAQSSIVALARPDFRPGVLAGARCLASRSGGCLWDVQARPAAGAGLSFALRPDPRLFGHGVDCVRELAEQGAEL
jgi:hypothetical protein